MLLSIYRYSVVYYNTYIVFLCWYMKWILSSHPTLYVSGNPCCSEPCENRGVCTAMGTDKYECDCTRTGFYGPNCTTRKYKLNTWAHLIWKVFICICSVVHFSSQPLQLNSSPGSKCLWSHRPTQSTTFSPTSKVSGISSTTSHFSGMASWDMCWHVSLSSWRQNEEMDRKHFI